MQQRSELDRRQLGARPYGHWRLQRRDHEQRLPLRLPLELRRRLRLALRRRLLRRLASGRLRGGFADCKREQQRCETGVEATKAESELARGRPPPEPSFAWHRQHRWSAGSPSVVPQRLSSSPSTPTTGGTTPDSLGRLQIGWRRGRTGGCTEIRPSPCLEYPHAKTVSCIHHHCRLARPAPGGDRKRAGLGLPPTDRETRSSMISLFSTVIRRRPSTCG